MDSPFGEVYLANVHAVSGFFARRCADPQTVADLTSETFVRAIASFRRFDPSTRTERAWLIGISDNVFRRRQGARAEGRENVDRLGGQLLLCEADVEELAALIDAQRTGRELLDRIASFPEAERTALELVDVMQMSPREAAGAVGISAGALRVRLFRARARLRRRGIDGI